MCRSVRACRSVASVHGAEYVLFCPYRQTERPGNTDFISRIGEKNMKSGKKDIFWGLLTGGLLTGIEALAYGGSVRIADALGIQTVLLSGTKLDSMIPTCPAFVFVYISAYAFWVLGPIWILRDGRAHAADFIVTYLLALCICEVILIVFPTGMDRVKAGCFPADKTGVSWKVLFFIYSIDGGETENCMVPSLHCLVSVFYYLEIREIQWIRKEHRLMVLLFVVLIILSTMFTKQHFWYDCAAGTLLAVICHDGIGRFHPGSRFLKEASDDYK